MKRILTVMISMATLCVCVAQAEEAGAPVRKPSIEEMCKMLEENFNDRGTVNSIMNDFCFSDGRDLSSYGNQEALDWARRLLREKKTGQGWDLVSALRYLIMKGDERDLDLIIEPWRDKLAMRIAGTNLLNYYAAQIQHQVVRNGIYDIVPSVTNTGPQAHYVLEILRQYWMKMDPPTDRYWGTAKDMSQIPDELLAIVVWFDEDGNPVCNVDLAKHGLTMPEIGLPQNVKDEILRRTRLNAAAEPLPLSEDDAQRPEAAAVMGNPSDRLWIYAGVISVLCVGAVLWCLRKKR